MTLWVSPPSPSSSTSFTTPMPPSSGCFPGPGSPSGDAALRADAPDGRPRRALRRHHRGVGAQRAVALQRPPVEAATGDLVHERQEEDHREPEDRPEAVDAELLAGDRVRV